MGVIGGSSNLNGISMRGKIFKRLTTLLSSTLFWSVFIFAIIPSQSISQPGAQDCAGDGPFRSIEQILDSPELFVGCEIEITGTLETRDQKSFSIRTASGRSLEVWSWAPTENDHHPRTNPEAMKPMSYFVGRRLHLTGRLLEERSGGVVLEVSTVEDLNEDTE
jgi:hypothetical protein